MIIDTLKKSSLVLFLRLIIQKWQETVFSWKHMSAGNINRNGHKLTTELTIIAHALEKGMSMGHVRPGFGKTKASRLISGMQMLINVDNIGGGKNTFLTESASIINQYILFNENLGADMSDIKKELKDFCNINQIFLIQQGGILRKQLSETQKMLTEDFEVFSQSRFSVRDFGDTPVSMNQIKKALKMCERTPTACNRQSVRIHVYSKVEDKNRMFRLQMGCKGFENNMQCAILICGDMTNYQFYEYSTLFTDGGIYAMNLLYALHREGLAAIPLTMGFKFGNLKRVKKGMNLPDNEIPILLIGVGSYKDEYKVAESHRLDYSTYCTFH